MLALLPNRILILVNSDGIALTYLRGGVFAPKQLTQKTLAYSLTDDQSHNLELINQSLNDLLTLLKKEFDTAGSQLEIRFSDYFVRYALLPPTQEALRRDEQTRLICTQFERIYGHAAKKWVYVAEPMVFNSKTLAAALDGQWLETLQKTATDHHLKLISVEPVLPFIVNYWKSLSSPNNCFVIVHDHTCTILASQNKAFLFVSQHLVSPNLTSKEFQSLIAREALVHGLTLDNHPLSIFAPKHLVLTANHSNSKITNLSELTDRTNKLSISACWINLLKS